MIDIDIDRELEIVSDVLWDVMTRISSSQPYSEEVYRELEIVSDVLWDAVNRIPNSQPYSEEVCRELEIIAGVLWGAGNRIPNSQPYPEEVYNPAAAVQAVYCAVDNTYSHLQGFISASRFAMISMGKCRQDELEYQIALILGALNESN